MQDRDQPLGKPDTPGDNVERPPAQRPFPDHAPGEDVVIRHP